MVGGPVEAVENDVYGQRAFDATHDKLVDLLDRQRRQEALPQSDPFGGETRGSNQRQMDKLAGEIVSALQASRLTELVDEYQAKQQAVAEAEGKIAAAEQAALTAPRTVSWPSPKRTQRDYMDAAAKEKKKIEAARRRQEQIVLAMRISLRVQGLELSLEQSRLVLDDPAAVEAMRLNAGFLNARQIDMRLAELTRRAGGNTFEARRSFRLHGVLLEVLAEPLRQEMARVDNQYVPRVRAMLAATAAARAETQRMLMAADLAARKNVQGDLRAQELNDKAAHAYLEYIEGFRLRLARAEAGLARRREDAMKALDGRPTADSLAAVIKSPAQDVAAVGASLLPALPKMENHESLLMFEDFSRKVREK